MFLGCDMPIQLVLSSTIDLIDYKIDYKIVSSCTDYVTDYKICSILCLNK